MVHLDDTATELTAVVRPVGFVVVACRAERRAAVPPADKDILMPEFVRANV